MDARTKLLAVARRRFAADGALTPTLDEVRREAAVSVGAMYHHFPAKSALAAAVYAQVITEYQAGFLDLLRTAETAGTAEGGVRGGVAYHLRWVAANRGDAALLLGDRLDSAELRDANRAFFGGVRDWWRPHHTYGQLRAMEPGITSALWLGPAQAYAKYWIATDEKDIPASVVDTFADAAWHALRLEH